MQTSRALPLLIALSAAAGPHLAAYEVITGVLGIAEPDHVAESLQGAVQYPSLNVRGLSSGWVGDQAAVPPKPAWL